MIPLSEPETPMGRLRRRFLKWAAFGALFAALATGAIGMQRARLREIGFYRPYIDSLNVPRKEYAKSVALGYDTILADFLYMRAIQAFGGQWKLAGATDEMMHRFRRYFDFMTELDPTLLSAYRLGSLVLSEEGHDYLGAIDLLKKGWFANPDKYRLPYLAFYTSWYSLKNDKMARLWLNRAVRSADCPEWVRRQQTIVDRESGHRRAAMERWIWEYLNGLDTRDENIRRTARMHFQDDTDEWNRDVLHKALARYMEDHDNRTPGSLEALDAAGYLKDYESCDYYKMMKLIDSIDLGGQQEWIGSPSHRAIDLLGTISEAVFAKRSGIPPTPFDPDPARDRYYLRRDLTPDLSSTVFEAQQVVVSFTYTRDFLKQALLPAVRARMNEFFSANWRYPFWPAEAFPEGLKILDPPTGTWNYDPLTGRVASPTFPDL
ncbi:hypothetical protein JW916_16710 [Candidatus Sumerlaeota bacterium]|nr:hypothetical protein [Candidatus Sumerlaeota bacterium]